MEKQTVKKQKVFLSLEQLYLSIFAIILSLLITALIMLVSGENPINAFQALLAGALGSKTAIATTLGKTVPLLFVGMACAFSNKAGFVLSFMCILTGLLNQNSYLNRIVEEPRNGQCSLYFATDRCKIYLSSLSRTDGFFLFCYNKIKEKNTSDMSQKERGMV